MSNDTDDLRGRLLSECDVDHVGLWEVIRMVERHRPDLPPEAVRGETLRLIGDLLAGHQVAAGHPTPDGRDFQPWDLTPAVALARIEREWQPGTRPTIGEIVWLTVPDNASVLARLPANQPAFSAAASLTGEDPV